MLMVTFVAAVVGVIVLIAGEQAGAVFQTLGYAGFLVPLVGTAGMLGVALTIPFARQGCFASSPWPAMYRGVMAVALGLGAYALAMLGLGAVHLLNPPWIPVLLQAVGAAVGFVPTRHFLRSFDRTPFNAPAGRSEWLLLLAAVPVAVAVIAATFPPGSLWWSEGHGYDVLEYHLQMPREYGWTNSIMPVAHNVYSYLPATVEMLYLLLMQAGKFAMGVGANDSLGHLWGVFPAQFLHLTLMLLTVAAVGLVPVRMNAAGRALAMVVMLAVPWTIITGSLAYDEWGMMLFGTLALGTALGERSGSLTIQQGVLIGLLLGLAVGCKLTAGIAFAVPVAVMLLMRGQMKTVVMAALLAGVLYFPWALRAAVASGGNPVFPLAANVLGRDGWTPEQVERFNHGHAALEGERSMAGRVMALVDASVLDEQWSPGIHTLNGWRGEASTSRAAWARFGILWLALSVAGVLALIGAQRGAAWMLIAVLAIQVVGWMLLTHLQSRFLLPMVVPLAWGCGLGMGDPLRGRSVMSGVIRAGVWSVVGVQAVCAGFLLLPEASLLGGVQKRGHANSAPPIGELFSRVINIAAAAETGIPENSPPPEGKILLVGGATPLFWQGDIVYTTVFDNSPLAEALRTGGPAVAARWLQNQHINYVVFDWPEIDRLRKTYGFDAAITPEAVQGLIDAGIRPVQIAAPPGWTILRVEDRLPTVAH